MRSAQRRFTVMTNANTATLDGWSGNWWALALRGAAALLLSIVAFTLPGVTLAAIVLIFGVYAIADGIFTIVAAVRGLRRHERWGAMLAQGIAGVLAGAIAILWPAIGALALTYLVAGGGPPTPRREKAGRGAPPEN